MEQSSSQLPHIYYTVNELSFVTDVKVLRNTNIKTLGYVDEDRVFGLDFKKETVEKCDISVKLDLSHVRGISDGIKPFLIFGVLFTVNDVPHILVKTAKLFNGGMKNLSVYHHQCLAIRARSPYFENINAPTSESK